MISLSPLFEKLNNFNDQHMYRKNIRPGIRVLIVEKQNQRNGKLTSGTVQRLLTNKSYHPRGIKVMLDDGTVGRVQVIKE